MAPPCPTRIGIWLCAIGALLSWSLSSSKAQHPLPYLTSAREILDLSPTAAPEPLLARLHGILTFSDPDKNIYHLHDGSHSIRLTYEGTENDRPLPPQGHRIEILGHTVEGAFGPLIKVEEWSDHGRAAALPPPLKPSLTDLKHGLQHHQWVELTGVVRSTGLPLSELKLASDAHPFLAYFAIPFQSGAADALIGATVRLRGNVGTTHTEAGKPVNFHLHVQDESLLEILSSGPADPFAGVPRPVAALYRLQQQRRRDQMVLLEGTVGYVHPNRFFYLEDPSGNIRVVPHPGQDLPKLKETVLVAGFMGEGPGGFSWQIADAQVRSRNEFQALKASVPRRAEDIIRMRPDGQRVLCEGKVLSVSRDNYGLDLLCEDNQHTFRVLVHAQGEGPRRLKEGALISVSGICASPFALDRVSDTFHLYCNSLDDVEILAKAPWLTSERAHLVLTLLATLILGGLLWVKLLQRTVRQQTATIEAERASLAYRVRERTEELRTANRELARAAEMKDVFLANMSHELRTPLNTVLGQTDALRLGFYGDIVPDQNKALEAIRKSGGRLLSLIDDLLDFARVNTGDLHLHETPVDLTYLCQACLDEIQVQAREKRITLHADLPPTPETVCGDEERIRQILANLLGNAMKFTPSGGDVGLEARVAPDSGDVELVVWDTGPGIAPEEQLRLFEPFTQIDASLSRGHEGAGLGLSLVKRLLELHEGQVSVESEPGKGARFTVHLPGKRRLNLSRGQSFENEFASLESMMS